jgi:uncharacterized protein YjbI with pentapeptide repeats
MERLLRRVRRWAGSGRVVRLAGVASLLVLLAALLAVIVYLPQLAIDPRGLSRTDWLKAVQDLRTSILQGLGGLAVLAGAVVAALNLRETSRQNRAVLELQRRGQTTERFTRAIEQVGQQGPEKLAIRLGGIYGLEQIALDSEELHWPIMEVLTAFLRMNSSVGNPPANDLQAIATVVGRRNASRDPHDQRLDLTRIVLTSANLRGAHLARAVLFEANLRAANLGQVHLEDAVLPCADLSRAYLADAHLQRANLHSARMEGANLSGAHLEETNLGDVHMEEADLRGAHLEAAKNWSGVPAHLERANLGGAHLDGADLRGARLEGSNLSGACLSGANLAGTDLTRAQLEGAHVDGSTVLPAHLLEASEVAGPDPR